MGKGYRGVASIFRVVRTNRSLCERRRLEPLGGSGGMLPREMFKFRGSEMPFLAFSRGHMFSILQDLRVHVAQWFKSANLMIKKRLLPINIFFLRFQVYARAYVRIWSLRPWGMSKLYSTPAVKSELK